MNTQKFKHSIFIILFTLVMLIPGYTQPPPPPGGNTGPGGSGAGKQLGGNAPIGSGMFILLALGATYGLKKRISLNNEKDQHQNE